MTIRKKIILSLASTAICILASYIIFLVIKSKRDQLLRQSYQNEQEASIRTAMLLNEKTMLNLLKDYSNWDNMVDFTHTRDSAWSRSNLSTVPATHQLSGMWIFNRSKQLIYSLTEMPPGASFNSLFTDSLFNFIDRQKSGYFFHRFADRFFEFSASSIRPTADTGVSSPTFGYLVLCRTMDNTALHNLEDLSGSIVSLIPLPSSGRKAPDEGQIMTNIILRTWNGAPIGLLEFLRNQPLLRSYLAITNITNLFYLFFALILLIGVSLALYRWLNYPMNKITQSLALEDSELIEPIACQKNEFGQIALMINKFFEQKKELACIINEKDEALALLADAESKNQAILSAIPDHLFRINLFGIISDCQVKNAGDFPFDPGQMIGRSFEEILPAGLSSLLPQAIEEVNKSTQPQSFTYTVPCQKNHVKHFETTISLTNMGDYLVVVRNITTRKEAEMALHRLLEKEGELNRLKTHFLTTVSHEFRTPLSAILSNIQILELYDEKWSADKKAPAFTRIQQAVKQMSSLLNDLSVVARDEEGKFQLNPVQFDLSIYLDELVKEITGTFSPAPEVTILMNLSDHKVTLDKDMLRYILSNLISNALKFTTSSASIGITVNDAPDHNIMLRITDTGIGIPKQDIAAIFEPFHRGQNVLHFPGTGLGLSIVKRCVDLHKGSVEIESKLGEGTVVTVILPRNLN